MFATLLKYEFRRTKNILLPLNLGGIAIGAFGYFITLIIMKLAENPDSDFIIALPLLSFMWIGLFFMLALLSTAVSIILCLQFGDNNFQLSALFLIPSLRHRFCAILRAYGVLEIIGVVKRRIQRGRFAFMSLFPLHFINHRVYRGLQRLVTMRAPHELARRNRRRAHTAIGADGKTVFFPLDFV